MDTPNPTPGVMELDQWRVTVINGLCDLAQLLRETTNAQFPTPSIYLSIYSKPAPTEADPYAAPGVTLDDVRMAMAAAPGGWSKLHLDNQISYTKTLNDAISVRLYVNRANVCTRVQVGTKTVEAQPEREVPVYEWRCDEPELEV